MDQSLEVLAISLRARKIDAAVVWEPTASRIGNLVGEEGVARIVATGHNFGIPDAGAIAMRQDFMQKHPQVAAAWLRTELEAQQFLLNRSNWANVSRILESQTAGISARTGWFSLYGRIPLSVGGSHLRDENHSYSMRVLAFLNESYGYLHAAGLVKSATPSPYAIDDSMARKLVNELKLPVPIGVIRATPATRTRIR